MRRVGDDKLLQVHDVGDEAEIEQKERDEEQVALAPRQRNRPARRGRLIRGRFRRLSRLRHGACLFLAVVGDVTAYGSPLVYD